VLAEFSLLEEIAGMAGVCLTAPLGAREFNGMGFVRQSDPIGLDSATGVPGIP